MLEKLKRLWRRFVHWVEFEENGYPRRKYTPVDD